MDTSCIRRKFRLTYQLWFSGLVYTNEARVFDLFSAVHQPSSIWLILRPCVSGFNKPNGATHPTIDVNIADKVNDLYLTLLNKLKRYFGSPPDPTIVRSLALMEPFPSKSLIRTHPGW